MTATRSPHLPGVPQSYSGNDATTVKPPRILPGAIASVFCSVIDGRVVMGHRIGDIAFAQVAFSLAEFRSLVPQLRAVVAQTKESAK